MKTEKANLFILLNSTFNIYFCQNSKNCHFMTFYVIFDVSVKMYKTT